MTPFRERNPVVIGAISLVALAVLLLAYNTVMAMVFAGTVRYRTPWDFLLALLAAFALQRAWELVLERRRAPVSSAVR